MRIAVDARPLLHATDGIGRYLRSLLDRMAPSPHEFLLYSHRRIPEPPAGREWTIRHGDLGANALSTPFAQACFPRWARTDAADVFWSPRHHLPLRWHGPSVVTIHDLVWKRAPETMVRLGRLIEAALMPPSVHRARAVIAVSARTARDLVAEFPRVRDKVVTIPEAPTVVPRPDAAPAQFTEPYLLVVGSLEPRKNVGRIIEAFLQSGLHRNHRLVLVGGAGWKSRELHRRLASSRLAHRIDYLGPVSDERLVPLYANAEFVVTASLYEGFSLPTIEAMAFGRAVLTSRDTVMAEIAGEAALAVDALSVDALASAMNTLASDAGLRGRLGAAGRERAQCYSWERAAAETLGVLEAAATA